MLMSVRSSLTITVQETLLVALYTVHRVVVEKSSTLISAISLGLKACECRESETYN